MTEANLTQRQSRLVGQAGPAKPLREECGMARIAIGSLEVTLSVRTNGPGCAGMAELIVEGGPLTLQLSGAGDPLILVAVIRLAD
jgi:hypothetical protein